MKKQKFKLFSNAISPRLKFLNLCILIPILVWFPIFYSTIFIFDNPSNLSLAYLIISQNKTTAIESAKRIEQGWLGNCDTYKIQNNQVIYHDTIIAGADANSIKYLECHYAKDKNHVYKRASIINEADSQTFQILNWAWGRFRNF